MCVCDWVKSQADGQFLDGVPLKRFSEMIRFRERHSSSYCCASFFCFWHISSLVPLCSLKETFSQDLILMVLFVCLFVLSHAFVIRRKRLYCMVSTNNMGHLWFNLSSVKMAAPGHLMWFCSVLMAASDNMVC